MTRVSIYIVAHADDWQLFMQPHAYNDLVSPDCKVVFIITTAGDAGADRTFWAAREEGLKSSVRFCIAAFNTISESAGTREINGHHLNYWSLNSATTYFFRLPDGNLNGSGFLQNHFQSLSAFRSQAVDHISAIDNSTQYSCWPDFYTTLQRVVEFERGDITNICIKYLNPDVQKNPNDHADHVATGHAIQEMEMISGLRQKLYVGYSVGNKSSPLDPTDLFWKMGMFSVYEKAVYDLSGYSTLKEGVSTYLKWCLSGPYYLTIDP